MPVLASPEVEGRLLLAREVAQILRLSTTMLYELINAGQITPVRFGRAVRFRREDVDALINRSHRPAADLDA